MCGGVVEGTMAGGRKRRWLCSPRKKSTKNNPVFFFEIEIELMVKSERLKRRENGIGVATGAAVGVVVPQ